jgi:hypothetical protein
VRVLHCIGAAARKHLARERGDALARPGLERDVLAAELVSFLSPHQQFCARSQTGMLA